MVKRGRKGKFSPKMIAGIIGILVLVLVFGVLVFGADKVSLASTGKAMDLGLKTPAVKPGIGTVSINSSPTGANAIIDGIYRGVTPLLYKGQTGKHILILQKEGYINKTVAFSLKNGNNPSLSWSLSSLAWGRFNISTVPSGIMVYLGEPGNENYPAPVGLTPLLTYTLPSGVYRVYIPKAGYQTYDQFSRIEPGRVTTLRISLVRQ